MSLTEKKQHNIALVMLCSTALVWGIGFILNKLLLDKHGFGPIPLTLNAVRFTVAAIVLLIIFGRKIRFSKKLWLYGVLNGLFLTGGFGFQVLGLNYTTPSSNGFFTVAYVLFVPFIAWIMCKRRPTVISFLGVVCALAGLAVLSITSKTEQGSNELLGNILTLVGSLFFAAQIVATEKALNDGGISTTDITVLQIAFCAIFTVIASLIFESKSYATVQIDFDACWWQLAIVSLGGTAFAYFSQSYGQMHLSSTETSIILACESPLGAIFSIALGLEVFGWQVLVGGILMFGSVVIMEILPTIVKRRKEKQGENSNDITENAETDSDKTKLSK